MVYAQFRFVGLFWDAEICRVKCIPDVRVREKDHHAFRDGVDKSTEDHLFAGGPAGTRYGRSGELAEYAADAEDTPCVCKNLVYFKKRP